MCDIRMTSSGIPIYATITTELQDTLEKWLPIRRQTIVQLRALADKLRSLTKGTNVATVVGSSTSLVGGIGTVACLIAAPATGGLSLLAGVICLAMGLTGAATNVGSAVTKHVVESDVVKEVEDAIVKEGKMNEKMHSCLLKFKEALDKEMEISEFIEKKAKIPAGVCRTVVAGAKLAGRALPYAKNSASTLIRLSPKASNFLGRIAIGTKFVGKALTIVSIPVDIYQVVKSANDIANGSPNEIAQNVMVVVHELQEEYEALKDLLDNIKKK